MELVTQTKIQPQCMKGGDSQTSGTCLRTCLSKNCCCSIMNEMKKGAHWRFEVPQQADLESTDSGQPKWPSFTFLRSIQAQNKRMIDVSTRFSEPTVFY